MKVGDYVRTPNGVITKIVDIQDEVGQYFANNNCVILNSKTYVADKNITIGENFKHSPNIIDLIEVGDYVNGRIVDDCIYLDKLGLIGLTELEKEDEKFIKSIVTKEQFESMEYKL